MVLKNCSHEGSKHKICDYRSKIDNYLDNYLDKHDKEVSTPNTFHESKLRPSLAQFQTCFTFKVFYTILMWHAHKFSESLISISLTYYDHISCDGSENWKS